MVKEFEGKKLLIMGGNPETTPLVKVANEMGLKTIVTSARHTDDAKKYAWKSYDVDETLHDRPDELRLRQVCTCRGNE